MKRIYSILLFLVIVFTPLHSYGDNLDNGLIVQLSPTWSKSDIDNNDKNLIYHGDNGGLELAIYSKRDLKSNKIHSWKKYSNKELTELAEITIKNQKSKSKASIEEWKIFDTDEMRFLIFYGEVENQDGNKKQYAQYITIENGGTLQFTFYKDSDFGEADISVFNTVVESAYFSELKSPGIDRKIIAQIIGVILAVGILISSVFWNIKRYRKKMENQK